MRSRNCPRPVVALVLALGLVVAFGAPPAFAVDSSGAARQPEPASASASASAAAAGEGAAAEDGYSAENDEAARARKELAESLAADYLEAVENYQAVLARQKDNAEAIAHLEAEIGESEEQLARSQAHLEETSVEMYKNAVQPGELLETVLAAPSLGESVTLYDDYTRLEAHRKRQCEDARAECEELRENLAALEEQRDSLVAQVEATRCAVAEAKDALRRAVHLDGDKFHQTQGNGVNCGATAFTVGVNILLGENRFTDNVKVWSSASFGCDSTVALAEKGRAWLKENKLDDLIDFQYVKGDIRKTDQLRAELEKGGVVVISSGAGSEWQRVDAAQSQKGLYPGGHWICFYGYSEGIFYANDSAVSAKRGAGCPYTEAQMQQWLDGRTYHAACVLSQKAPAR